MVRRQKWGKLILAGFDTWNFSVQNRFHFLKLVPPETWLNQPFRPGVSHLEIRCCTARGAPGPGTRGVNLPSVAHSGLNATLCVGIGLASMRR